MSTKHSWPDWRKKHGHAEEVSRGGKVSPTYRSWQAMVQRCTNPNSDKWHLYGGRGVTVCDAWLDFRAFLADMGERPIGTTLDRRDNDGPYIKSNCRWATRLDQNMNRSCTVDRAEVYRLTDTTRLSQDSIARRLGISQGSVSNILRDRRLNR